MFGTKRKNRAEQIAEEAWDNLASVMESAGDTARSVGRRTGKTAQKVGRRTSDLADDAQARVSSVADEAWTRATNAFEALAGRGPRKPWGWIAVGVLSGIAVGWAVAATAPKAVSAAMDRFHELDEEEVAPVVPGSPTPAGTRTHSQA